MNVSGKLWCGVALVLLTGCETEVEPPVQIKTRQGELREFPERGLALLAPPNFVKSGDFVGLEDEAKQTTIVLQRFAVPFQKMVPDFVPTAMETVERSVVRHQPVTVSETTGLLIESELGRERNPQHQWTLAFGDGAQTYRIDANVPFDRVEEMRPVVLSCLESAKAIPWVPALSYQVEPIAGLVELRESLSSGATMLTPNGEPSDLLSAGPRFSIYPRTDLRPVAEILEQFARTKIETYADVPPDQISGKQAIEIDGLPGVELTADGTLKAGDEPIGVYFVLLAEPNGGYVTLVGVCPVASKAEWFPRFQQAARSFHKT